MRLAALLLFASTCLCRASDTVAGRWEGAVQIPGAEVRLVIDLAQSGDGKWSGSAILPGFGVKGAPLADLAVTDSGVNFSLAGVFGDPKFTGHLAAGSISGDFTQSGNTAPFALRNTGPPQVEPPRVSTPVHKELEGEWRSEFELFGSKLRARLTLTNESGRTVAKFVVGNKKDTELPVDFVSQDGDWLTVQANKFGIAYEGRYSAGKNEIEGAFEQAGFESPLVFHREANNGR
jgi:hypothetical protein